MVGLAVIVGRRLTEGVIDGCLERVGAAVVGDWDGIGDMVGDSLGLLLGNLVGALDGVEVGTFDGA